MFTRKCEVVFAVPPRRRTRGEDVPAKIVHVIACDLGGQVGFFYVFVFAERVNKSCQKSTISSYACPTTLGFTRTSSDHNLRLQALYLLLEQYVNIFGLH